MRREEEWLQLPLSYQLASHYGLLCEHVCREGGRGRGSTCMYLNGTSLCLRPRWRSPTQCPHILPILYPCLKVFKAQQRGRPSPQGCKLAEQGTLGQKGLDGLGASFPARAGEAWGKPRALPLQKSPGRSCPHCCLHAYRSKADKSSAGRRIEQI